MSTSRNSGPKTRIREFARRSGFTYQQAQQFLNHFDARRQPEYDTETRELRTVLSTDIRVSDWTFYEGEQHSNYWSTRQQQQVREVELLPVDLHDGSEEFHVSCVDGTGDTFLAHAQTLVMRLKPGASAKADTTRTIRVPVPTDLNLHLGLRNRSDPKAGTRVLQQIKDPDSAWSSGQAAAASTLPGILEPDVSHVLTESVLLICPRTITTSVVDGIEPFNADIELELDSTDLYEEIAALGDRDRWQIETVRLPDEESPESVIAEYLSGEVSVPRMRQIRINPRSLEAFASLAWTLSGLSQLYETHTAEDLEEVYLHGYGVARGDAHELTVAEADSLMREIVGREYRAGRAIAAAGVALLKRSLPNPFTGVIDSTLIDNRAALRLLYAYTTLEAFRSTSAGIKWATSMVYLDPLDVMDAGSLIPEYLQQRSDRDGC
ncbi:hypothetical protein [Gordonia sihwensis]|uniref:hypothetical protein n=1 Tax=Gordonia sihwensis TaxID=173559 RepID=UPI0005ED7D3D|nr:hypothetical protein [Gordonia sihwensis]KJR10244.1 hypothetical protein UG54_01300 [Gordonia sihwensis]